MRLGEPADAAGAERGVRLGGGGRRRRRRGGRRRGPRLQARLAAAGTLREEDAG